MAKRKRSLFSNRKATIQDILFIMIVLTVFAVATLIVFKISDEINTKIQDSSQFTTEGKAAIDSTNSMYPGIVNNTFLLLTIGLAITAFIFAAMVRIHPIFIALFIFVLILVVFFAGIFSNIYQKIAEEPEMTALADRLTFMSTILQWLPLITLVVGSLLAIVMYKTWQGAQF